jgi:MFS family permease
MTTVTGLVVMLITLWLSGDHVTNLRLIPGMVIVGLGNGLAFPSLVGAVIAGVHVRQAGGAAGILTTTQQFASAAGVAVLGTIFFSVLGSHPDRSDFVSALEVSILLGILLIGCASGLTVLLRPRTATEDSSKSVEVVELVS